MIVKIEDVTADKKEFRHIRHFDVMAAEIYTTTKDNKTFLELDMGITIELTEGDVVYYLNNDGQTIDKDLRMTITDNK